MPCGVWQRARCSVGGERPRCVEAVPKLKALIKAGRISQKEAILRERECLRALYEYESGTLTSSQAVNALLSYEGLFSGRKNYTAAYTEILEDAPWRDCKCGICEQSGINVILFRGSERNKRRGFHNLYVFRQRLDRELGRRSAA